MGDHTHSSEDSKGHHPSIDTWGTIGHLTDTQKEALVEFTAQVSNDDLMIAKFRVESIENVSLRFLRARSFNVANALQLLHDCVKRKKDGHADKYAALDPNSCAKCDVEALKKWYPHGQLGYDKFNRPILFEHSGGVDGNAIHQMTNTDGLINYHWWSMDHALNSMFDEAANRGDVVISTCVVLDLTGLNSHHCSQKVLDHVKSLVALDNVCYPELLGKMFVINAPWLAVTVYDMIKHWLDPRTQAKIEILGSGPDTTRRLLEYISPDNLPVAFGGTGPTFTVVQENAEYVHVPRYGAIKKTIVVPPKKKLMIESYVTDGEIGFEVYCRKVPASQAHAYANKSGHNYESISLSEWTKFVSTHEKELNNFAKKELKNTHENPSHNPLKVALECFTHPLTPEEENKGIVYEYYIAWTNTARFYTRPLIYNLVMKDESAVTPVTVFTALNPHEKS